MRIIKLSAVVIVFFLLGLSSGCNDQLKDCKIQNDIQREEIQKLRSELQATKLQLEQAKRQLAAAESRGGAEVAALRQQIAALEEEVAKKKSLISAMQQRLLYGGAELPVELSTMLEDFAKKQDMVTYDAAKGIVKFKSDLLFEKGSDKVAPGAAEAIGQLCEILNTEQAKQFDIIIAGHTDDIPIAKPETRAKHPTNWHLSAHRAISVLNVMSKNGLVPERMSIRGFGEYRPAVPNKPNKRGNPQNRRVEIYLVPHGM